MEKRNNVRLVTLLAALSVPVLISHPALAASGDIGSVENFIRSIIAVLAGLAGLVATGFFVIGGFSYITSSGHPEHLDKAKQTIKYAAIGLVITMAAFVISNIVAQLATNAFGK